MTRVACRSALGAALALCGCFQLDPKPHGQTRSPDSPSEVWFDPPASDQDVAPIVQIHLQLPSASLAPTELLLVQGTVSSREMKALQKGEPSQAFQKRLVSSLLWSQSPSELVLAPTRALQSKETYTLLAPSLDWSHSFSVTASDELPTLRLLWPPSAEPISAKYAVWCKTIPARGHTLSSPTETALGPDLVSGFLDFGAMNGIGQGCVRWQSDSNYVRRLMPPPVAQLEDGTFARIEPIPLVAIESEPMPLESSSCSPGQIPFGPGCAEVLDDRLVLSLSGESVLLGLQAGELFFGGVVSEKAPLVVYPLPASSSMEARITFFDQQANGYQDAVWIRTQEPLSHVIINEVMTNPLGAEPSQEWVELYNDGLQPVQLEGWALEDVGGSAELPPFEIAPGQYVLVVNESYEPDGWLDRAPESNTALLRVAQLARSGLSNSGEPLRLVNALGETASRVPPIACPKASVSIARVSPQSLDSVGGSFGYGPDGGTPGGPNATVPLE